MPKRLRLSCRFSVAMTEDGYRRLKRFAADADLEEAKALSFLFENFNSVTHSENLAAPKRLFRAQPDDRKHGYAPWGGAT